MRIRMMKQDRHQTALWLNIIVLTLGRSFLDVWPDMVGHSPALVSVNALIETSLPNGRVLFSLGICVGALLIMLFPQRAQKHWHSLAGACLLLSLLSTGGYALVAWGGIQVDASAVGSAAFMIGFSYGITQAMLLCATARIPRFSTIVWFVALSRILKTVIVEASAAFPPSVQIVLTVASPLIAVVAAMVATKSMDRQERMPIRSKKFKEFSYTEVLLGMFLIVFACFCAVARSFSTLGFWGYEHVIDPGMLWPTLPTMGIFLVLVYIVFARHSEKDIVNRLIVACIMVLGFIVLVDSNVLALVGVPSSGTVALRTMIEMFAQYLSWIAAIAVMRTLAMPPLRIMGIRQFTMSSLSVVILLVMSGSSELGKTIVTVMLYTITVVALLVIQRKYKEGMSHPSSGDVLLEERCRLTAERYRLSPRETEVLALLAQGRSRAFIQEELFLSDSTVKTHIRNIYQKVGVHNKQDIITLINECR